MYSHYFSFLALCLVFFFVLGTGVDIAIMNANGEHLPQGQKGEVCLKGRNVTKGFVTNFFLSSLLFSPFLLPTSSPFCFLSPSLSPSLLFLFSVIFFGILCVLLSVFIPIAPFFLFSSLYPLTLTCPCCFPAGTTTTPKPTKTTGHMTGGLEQGMRVFWMKIVFSH